MTRPSWFEPSQKQALNPLLVMLLIPFNNMVLFPALRRVGIEPPALQRMGAGIALAGLSWVAVGAMQLALEAGVPLSITFQVVPYALLTLGEVLVAATGLEFAYSQAPAAMKSAIMVFWSLSVAVGAAGQRGGSQRRGHAGNRSIRPGGGEPADVFLRCLRLPCCPGLRAVRGMLPARGSLPEGGIGGDAAPAGVASEGNDHLHSHRPGHPARPQGVCWC
jgi:hypothetical protein